MNNHALVTRLTMAAAFALALAFLFLVGVLVGRAAAANDELNDRDADWVFRCSDKYEVYIYGDGQFTFTIRGIEPPFQLTWIKEDEPVLTVENTKCEMIYPVEQG